MCTDEPELAKVKVKHKESAAKNRKDQSEYFKENYQNCCKKIARQRAQKKSANFFHSKKCNKNHKACSLGRKVRLVDQKVGHVGRSGKIGYGEVEEASESVREWVSGQGRYSAARASKNVQKKSSGITENCKKFYNKSCQKKSSETILKYMKQCPYKSIFPKKKSQ